MSRRCRYSVEVKPFSTSGWCMPQYEVDGQGKGREFVAAMLHHRSIRFAEIVDRRQEAVKEFELGCSRLGAGEE